MEKSLRGFHLLEEFFAFFWLFLGFGIAKLLLVPMNSIGDVLCVLRL